MVPLRRRLLLAAERASWTLGVAGLLGLGVFHASNAGATRQDLERFRSLQSAVPRADTPDQSLWSPARVRAWHAALIGPSPAPLAVMRISKIQLEVPVLPGTDDRTLDRAVGHIDGTALPGTDGNSAVAGHRDGFFRGLKDIVPGDDIELETLTGKEIYRVARTWVVNPDDVTVLNPTPMRSLTLVTCYPFYYVGAAPQRFIVRAVLAGDRPAGAPPVRPRSPVS
jgi:sortase A